MWEQLRRFLRSGRLQIEEPGVSFSPIAAVSLVPEAVDVTLEPREHLRYEWLPWKEAAERTPSWTNRDAILLLPQKRAAGAI